MSIQELKVEELRKRFDPKELGIESTKNLKKLTGLVGQERAVRALQFGLSMTGVGYNIYVAGPSGTGKMTSVKSFIEEVASKKETPPDWCYVNNFGDQYTPKAIELPAGKGCELKKDMENLIGQVRDQLPNIFEGEEYQARREEIISNMNQKREEITQKIDEKVSNKGFAMQPSPMGILLAPLKEGKPINEEELQNLPEEKREEMQKKRRELQNELKETMKDMRKIEKDTQKHIKKLDRQITLNTIGGLIEDLIEKYEDHKKVIQYLKDVQEDIMDNIDTFKLKPEQQGGNVPPQVKAQMQSMKEIAFKKYNVNVLVDNSKQKGAPVIVEHNPTYNNLLGRIEKEMRMGALTTDFSMIKAGSLPQANGGFLVLPIEDLIRNYFSYDGLKRTLRSGEIQIEELGERLGFMTVKSVRPEPIPVQAKVVLVGLPVYFHLLHTYDEDFPELFKVKADFDVQMNSSDDNIRQFMSFVSTFCENEKLKHLNGSAVAKVLEHGLRMADDQEKLSTQFGLLGDVLRESDYWANRDKADIIQEKHVVKAIDERIYRSSLLEERIQEMIERGTLLIDTEGKEVGQVNGLSVISLGNYMFGRPSRITATVGPGRGGIVDIEREVKLGGPIHSKGVLILSGYFAKTYASGKPLTLSARLVFEQSYSGVDGDSASAAELFSIISALSDIPLRQDVAVTGSVNQRGEIQAIGGVNQKIEGFFEVCKKKGMNGKQGVMIPQSNVKNLMLKEEIVQAVAEDQFHIWAIKTINDGIEILTSLPAGDRQDDGSFSKDSVNEKVRQKLFEYGRTIKNFGKSNDSEKENKE